MERYDFSSLACQADIEFRENLTNEANDDSVLKIEFDSFLDRINISPVYGDIVLATFSVSADSNLPLYGSAAATMCSVAHENYERVRDAIVKKIENGEVKFYRSDYACFDNLHKAIITGINKALFEIADTYVGVEVEFD